MNTKLIEKIKRSAIKGRLGDFICNFIAVVLGIAITFVGSDMIQEHNKKKRWHRSCSWSKVNYLSTGKQ